MKNIYKFIIAILVVQSAGLIGALFTNSAVNTWYAGIVKPAIAPPNWVFGPVWTTLFIMIGISLFLVWKKGFETQESKRALGVFVLQLIANTLWSIIFFRLQSPGWAFVELLVLWVLIVANIIVFARISRVAGLLLVPYLLWVSFAGYLNFTLWMLN